MQSPAYFSSLPNTKIFSIVLDVKIVFIFTAMIPKHRLCSDIRTVMLFFFQCRKHAAIDGKKAVLLATVSRKKK